MNSKPPILKTLVCILAECHFLGAAVLAGTVGTSGGRPVRATILLHDLSTVRASGRAPFDHQFGSKADGSFTISGVPNGKYQICVNAPNENVLDPCLWSPGTDVVDLSTASSVSGVTLKVETGYMLQVHVNDPQSLLPLVKGETAGEALSLTVETKNSRFQNFRLPNASVASRDHYLLVPFDETMTLTVSSSTLALSDGNNQRLANDTLNIPVRIPSGGSIGPIVINIGKR